MKTPRMKKYKVCVTYKMEDGFEKELGDDLDIIAENETAARNKALDQIIDTLEASVLWSSEIDESTKTGEINLAVGKKKVFAGRKVGEDFRERLDLDEEDLKPGYVEVTFPVDLISINTSFFLGLFGKSVQKLGGEQFRKKYFFKEITAHIDKSITEGIDRALKERF